MHKNRTNTAEPKHVIHNSKAFQKGREVLGEIILNDMQTTGGTDIDWLIEHRGGFIIFEFKEFHDDVIPVSVGQMIAYQKLHKALNTSSKCYFLFIGINENMDFKNPKSLIWYFEMEKWNDGSIPHKKSLYGKAYLIDKQDMQKTSVGNYRKMIEVFWKELETKNQF